MKTSGFREIDFSKTECKHCGKDYNPISKLFVPKGSIITARTEQFSASLSMSFNTSVTIEDCPVCKGTGFIDESATTELELE